MSEGSFWKGRRVLVTGARGFIGGAVVRRLSSLGASIVGIVRDAADVYYLERTLVGDVTDYCFVRDAVSSYEVDIIFHFAAKAIVRISARDPLTTFRTNVMGTVNVLEAAREVGRCAAVVVASSDKAYGDHDELPYVETAPLCPRNAYDASKACVDMVAQSYGHNYDMPVIVTRCSNVYGPGDANYSRIVPNTFRRLFDGKRPLIYSDIEQMEREFIYVDDVVDAYLGLAEAAAERKILRPDVYNVGGTGPVKIRDLVECACLAAGFPDAELEIVPREPEHREIVRQYIDAGKLERAIGWKPKFKLMVGLERAANWYRCVDIFGGKTA